MGRVLHAAAGNQVGVVAVVVAGLVYCSFVVVYGLRRSGDHEIGELLLDDLVSHQPVLLPRLPASPVKLGLPSPEHAEQRYATGRQRQQNLQQAKAGAESAIRGVGEVGWSVGRWSGQRPGMRPPQNRG